MVVIAPLVAAAGIQAVGGLAEGFLGNAAKQQMAANDRAFQTFAAQQSAANNIMGLNASLGQGMSNNRWANMLGPDADQLRQFTAAKQKAAFLDPSSASARRVGDTSGVPNTWAKRRPWSLVSKSLAFSSAA